MVLHHLDDATLMRFASGDLDEAFSVVVAAHIAMCGQSRTALRAAEGYGGAFLDTVEAVDLSGGAFQRLMERVAHDGESNSKPLQRRITANCSGDVPAPLQRFIGPSLAGIPWKTVVPNVRKHSIQLSSPAKSSLYMLKIAPGKAVPEHGHGGSELTLVLSGAYRDELGRFGPGDIADLDEDIEHQPRVEPGEPCICIVATEAPTRFKGRVSRLIQPLVQI